MLRAGGPANVRKWFIILFHFFPNQGSCRLVPFATGGEDEGGGGGGGQLSKALNAIPPGIRLYSFEIDKVIKKVCVLNIGEKGEEN